MFYPLNEKIIGKLPLKFSGTIWKTTLYLVLLSCWVVILIGTYLLLK